MTTLSLIEINKATLPFSPDRNEYNQIAIAESYRTSTPLSVLDSVNIEELCYYTNNILNNTDHREEAKVLIEQGFILKDVEHIYSSPLFVLSTGLYFADKISLRKESIRLAKSFMRLNSFQGNQKFFFLKAIEIAESMLSAHDSSFVNEEINRLEMELSKITEFRSYTIITMCAYSPENLIYYLDSRPNLHTSSRSDSLYKAIKGEMK